MSTRAQAVGATSIFGAQRSTANTALPADGSECAAAIGSKCAVSGLKLAMSWHRIGIVGLQGGLGSGTGRLGLWRRPS